MDHSRLTTPDLQIDRDVLHNFKASTRCMYVTSSYVHHIT